MLDVYILGATGLVGQRFVQLLSGHPWMRIAGVAASQRSAGKKYRDSVRWILESPIPDEVADLDVDPVDPSAVPENVSIVFSALPSQVAAQVEPELAKRGFVVVSNASNMRMDGDVPLVVPEVNPHSLDLVKAQRESRGWDGFIVKKPNCSTTILALPLKPIMDRYGVSRVTAVTLQAVTGAGFSGVPSVAIIDNVVPHIAGEEEKIEGELPKILGHVDVRATTTRVPVLDGHMEVVYVETVHEVDVEEVGKVLSSFRGVPQELGLPTAPRDPIVVRWEVDRPQPRLDRWEGRGMSVVVGRIRRYGDRAMRFLVLGHNTVRGAAGNSILTAELLARWGLVT